MAVDRLRTTCVGWRPTEKGLFESRTNLGCQVEDRGQEHFVGQEASPAVKDSRDPSRIRGVNGLSTLQHSRRNATPTPPLQEALVRSPGIASRLPELACTVPTPIRGLGTGPRSAIQSACHSRVPTGFDACSMLSHTRYHVCTYTAMYMCGQAIPVRAVLISSINTQFLAVMMYSYTLRPFNFVCPGP